ncbi:MAG: hypothetical protein KDB47_18105 [Mycobacterium sp.]|nr:hypothetical protein [Mycobacterium sp.]
MRVVTFAPALVATEEDTGGISAKGFPMTSCIVDVFPAEITISIVAAVCGLSGDEYDPVRYIIVTSPAGERVSAMEFSWHWDDNPDVPVKFRVFAQHLPIRVESEGTYTLGLHTSLEGSEPEQSYPLPVILNPNVRRTGRGDFGTMRL